MGFSDIAQPEFAASIEQYRRELQTHCYRLMGSIQDAEDMVQETLLRAWRRRETIEARASLRPWLYRIATNICLDALRKRPRRYMPITREAVSTLAEPIPSATTEPVWLDPYPDDLMAPDEHDPEAYLAGRESITLAFLAALHLLPPRQRAALILRDVLDWQTSEVADLLDTTVSAVKSALHRARSTLADHRVTSDSHTRWMLDGTTHAQLQDYVRAWETADINTLVQLLTEDATFSMPPIPSWCMGRDTIRELTAMTVFHGEAQGRWRLLPTRANYQPAFALYRHDGSTGIYQAYGIQVLALRGGLISDVTTFRSPSLFPHFRLPLSLHQA